MVNFTVHVKHPNHDHILIPQSSSETPYTCNGCKETGWGFRFRCEICNYDLHKDCAYATDPITHLFYKRCDFKFRSKGYAGTHCTACGKKAEGFHYDGGRKYKLHPCCAKLKPVLEFDEGDLLLEECVHTTKCCKCRNTNLFGKEKGWSYRSRCKKHHIHVACLKDLVKELAVKKWERKNFIGNEDIFLSVPGLQETFVTLGGSSNMNSNSSRIAAVILNLVLSVILGIPSDVFNFLVFKD